VLENIDQNKQLARMIYHKWMSNMKFTLDLEEFSYKESGRNDPRYKFFKKQLMSNTDDALRQLFEDLEDIGILIQTEYDEDVKDGYKDSLSGGSSYINSESLDKWFEGK
jgi:hypothetical protein